MGEYRCCMDENNWEKLFNAESLKYYWCCKECGCFVTYLGETNE